MMEDESRDWQKAWLTRAKREISAHVPGLTWDAFAKMVPVEPRTMKSYRMPRSSAEFRSMPKSVEQLISDLVRKYADGTPPVAPQTPQDHSKLLFSALAAFVVRQAKEAVISEKVITGVSLIPGSGFGLEPRDREAMALVSRHCLINGLTDHGSEVHNLLAKCTKPFSQWLPIPELNALGLMEASFIDPNDLVPTPEAEELAKNFGDVVQSLEESLFSKLKELLSRSNKELADSYYTRIREFVARHPVCKLDQIQEMGRGLSSVMSMLIQQQFYEPVPDSWATTGQEVEICAHCANALEQTKLGKICRTRACAAQFPTQSNCSIPASQLVRATKGICQYWIEPGFDEIVMFDALVAMGLSPTLYPNSDQTDISFKEVGIDLKSYVSPETLGYKLQRSIGGLAAYPQKWLVIPDWLVNRTPSYLQRLETAMGRTNVQCLSVTEALKLAKRISNA